MFLFLSSFGWLLIMLLKVVVQATCRSHDVRVSKLFFCSMLLMLSCCWHDHDNGSCLKFLWTVFQYIPSPPPSLYLSFSNVLFVSMHACFLCIRYIPQSFRWWEPSSCPRICFQDRTFCSEVSERQRRTSSRSPAPLYPVNQYINRRRDYTSSTLQHRALRKPSSWLHIPQAAMHRPL